MEKDRRFGYKTASPLLYKDLKEFAKANRHNPTPAEDFLWQKLRNGKLGYRFRRQHPVGECIPDFVCLTKQLIIEVDGDYHDSNEQIINDYHRTQDLASLGFKVLRFTNNQILSNINMVITSIKEALSREASPSLGGGKGEATLSREASPSLGGGKGEATLSREASPSLGGGRGRLLIGIFGGSFNPIHNGHIQLARALRDAAGLDEVWFMVSPLNPFKVDAADLLDDERRLEMVSLALSDEQGMRACNYEFHLPKPSYTIDTLRALSRDYPNYSFSLLIGGDNWQAFGKWKESDKILGHYPIFVYPRSEGELCQDSLPQGVTIISTPLLPISSTEIRRRIRAGESISGMVPQSIEDKAIEYYSCK